MICPELFRKLDCQWVKRFTDFNIFALMSKTLVAANPTRLERHVDLVGESNAIRIFSTQRMVTDLSTDIRCGGYPTFIYSFPPTVQVTLNNPYKALLLNVPISIMWICAQLIASPYAPTPPSNIRDENASPYYLNPPE